MVGQAEHSLIEQCKANATDENNNQVRLADVEREISHIMAAMKASIVTSSTKEMLVHAETERDKIRQSV